MDKVQKPSNSESIEYSQKEKSAHFYEAHYASMFSHYYPRNKMKKLGIRLIQKCKKTTEVHLRRF
jgi:hypothetical protein